MKNTVRSIWGESILDRGWILVPNTLIDKQKELDLSDDDLAFIIKIIRFSRGVALSDKKFESILSSRTLQRRRQSLINKGYLSVYHKKESFEKEEKKYRTIGIVYDLSGLKNAIDLITKEQNKAPTERKSNYRQENFRGNFYCSEKMFSKLSYLSDSIKSSLNTFFDEYFNFYSEYYSLIEKDLSVDLGILENAKYIMDYVKRCPTWESGMTPRLVFFEKVSFRRKELVSFVREQGKRTLTDEQKEALRYSKMFYEFLLTEKLSNVEVANKYFVNNALYNKVATNTMEGLDYKEALKILSLI